MNEMHTPKASIVVPSRGGAQRLPVLLAALKRQTEQDFEIIVVLDGDIDGSRPVVAREANGGGLQISVIEFPENRGRVAALNAGFEQATGQVYIRCDDDFEPRENYVARHVAQHEGVRQGVIGVAENVFGPAAQTAYARVYGMPADAHFHEAAYRTSPDETWKFWAGNVSIDAQTYAEVGPYDPDYRAYGYEDVDWGYRLHSAGVPIIIDPELTTPHHLAAVTTVLRSRRAYQSASARHAFERKHPEAMADYHLPWSPWNALVRAGAGLPPGVTLHIAAGVDHVITRLPARIAGKLVALVVESSALGGRWHPEYTDLGI